VIHAVRVLGYADTIRVSTRAGVPEAVANEVLLDAQAVGHVSWSQFDDGGGWSLTEVGRREGERLLAEELDGAGASGRAVVEAVLADFGPLNEAVGSTCTRWQLHEMELAPEPVALPSILTDLGNAANGLADLERRLTIPLPRFAGYYERFTAALAQAVNDPAWVTGIDRDSAHRVWFELHEDLLATTSRSR
jgi:hypothetical protein